MSIGRAELAGLFYNLRNAASAPNASRVDEYVSLLNKFFVFNVFSCTIMQTCLSIVNSLIANASLAEDDHASTLLALNIFRDNTFPDIRDEAP